MGVIPLMKPELGGRGIKISKLFNSSALANPNRFAIAIGHPNKLDCLE